MQSMSASILIPGNAAPADDFYDIDAAIGALETEHSREAVAEARRWAGQTLYGDDLTSLRAMRLARGMSQVEFANALNTNQGTVSRWENGRGDMRASTMRRIASVLSVPFEAVCGAVCELFEGREERHA